MDGVEYLYAVVDGEEEGDYEVYFSTVEDWEETGLQTEEAIDEICELMSGLGFRDKYDNLYVVDRDGLKVVLEEIDSDQRFEMRDDFTRFIDS